jgi:hydrogenase nickel incorporation protein HypA/HybF
MQLLNYVLAEAKERGASRVVAIRLNLGAGTGLSPESLDLHFQHVAEGTIAEGARLDTQEVPLVYKCAECGQTTESEDRLVYCPECGQAKLAVQSGEDLQVEAVEFA